MGNLTSKKITQQDQVKCCVVYFVCLSTEKVSEATRSLFWCICQVIRNFSGGRPLRIQNTYFSINVSAINKLFQSTKIS
jgi:hypothetical protein